MVEKCMKVNGKMVNTMVMENDIILMAINFTKASGKIAIFMVIE
jgi:hypothetical protein